MIEGASCFADPSCWRGGHVAEEQLLHEQAGVLACREAWTEHDNTMQHVLSPSSAMIGTGGAIQILARVLKEVPWHKMQIGRFRVSAKLQNLTFLAQGKLLLLKLSPLSWTSLVRKTALRGKVLQRGCLAEEPSQSICLHMGVAPSGLQLCPVSFSTF